MTSFSVHAVFAAAVAAVFLLFPAGAEAAGGLRPFSSDGCSLFPDGNLRDRTKWCDCCFEHDVAYWKGGTAEERERADAALRDCVLDRTGDKTLAEMMYGGVRVGGHPAFLIWYRWAYGWDYGRGYRELSEQEQLLADERVADYRLRHPDGYCRER